MNLFLPILAVGASAAVWLWIIRRYDKVEPEPLKTLLYAGLVGGLMSVFFASLLNNGALVIVGADPFEGQGYSTSLLIISLFVGCNEEAWKAAATVLLMRNHRAFNEPIDGMIYALTVSLGFSALENLEYVFGYGMSVIVGRSLLSMPVHLACGAIWGYGFARIKFLTRDHKYLTGMVPYVFLAGMAHAGYDFLIGLDSAATVLVIPLLIILVLFSKNRLKYLLIQSPFLASEECPFCRTVNPQGSNFCIRCGANLRQDFYQACSRCTGQQILDTG